MDEAPEPRGSAAEDPGTLAGDLALDRVTFGYEPGAPVLVDVTLSVPAGTMTAIVGASGSGKSSIVRLLLGLEVPDEGTVLFDRTSLSSLDRAAVLAQMGVVPQDAALVPGSILDNILVAAPELGEDAAWRAAEQAQVAEDIRAMPMGMQTVVSDGASSFSGGQRQRLMLARALVHQPRILVLDEATSALDNPTQERVAAAIAALGATRVVVAHRLSTIRHADQIVVLERGRIVEVGTYDELLRAGGVFSRLADRQLTG
jgi:ABC-type bacteriocin/lantibiotic exporter with double-glycine peptidase domain